MKIIIAVLLVIVGILLGLLTSVIMLNPPASQNELMKNFYLTENAVHVSPHSLRLKMDRGDSDFILVDVRSRQEYEKEHIIGAINIPAYISPNTSIRLDIDKNETEGIIDQFADLPENKEIIVYCYSMPCMTGRKVGNLLAKNGIYVKQLGIGWNEWRYYWSMWNHEGETAKPEDYIVTGTEPGTPMIKNYSTSCSVGQLGC